MTRTQSEKRVLEEEDLPADSRAAKRLRNVSESDVENHQKNVGSRPSISVLSKRQILNIYTF